MTLPGVAGWPASVRLPLLFVATARLFPYPKIPGAACATVNEKGTVAAPSIVTIAIAGPGATSAGISKLICCGPTYHSGAAVLLIVTLTPPSEVGKGTAAALHAATARLLPKIVDTE